MRTTWTQPVRETEPPAILTVPAEARSFQGERAGIVSRVLANAIDLAILVVSSAPDTSVGRRGCSSAEERASGSQRSRTKAPTSSARSS